MEMKTFIGNSNEIIGSIFEHFSVFGFILLPSIIYARPSAMLPESKPIGALRRRPLK